MRNSLLLFCALFFTLVLQAQQETFTPHITAKWAPTGLMVGSLSLQGEYNFGRNSLTAKIGIPVNSNYTFQYDGKDANFNLKATSFLAGYRTYLSKKHMKGLYLEPYFKYLHHTSEGVGTGSLGGQPVVMNFINGYNGVGVGLQLGAQFFIAKRLVIDLFLIGPEINSSTNNFKAMEVSSTIPWTMVQTDEVANDIRNFVNKFPIIRDKVNIMVDQNNKTVTAAYSGFMPGFRTGVSFGWAF